MNTRLGPCKDVCHLPASWENQERYLLYVRTYIHGTRHLQSVAPYGKDAWHEPTEADIFEEGI